MTRSTALAFTHGQTADSTTACGKMGNSTARGSTSFHRACRGEVNGEMAIENDGSTLPLMSALLYQRAGGIRRQGSEGSLHLKAIEKERNSERSVQIDNRCANKV